MHKAPHRKLVDLVLGKPPQGSNPEQFEVIAEIGFGMSRITEGKFVADVGLSEAKLIYEAQHCRPKANSRYGSTTKLPGVSVEAAQWIFTEPRSDEGVLRGRPAGLDALMSMEGEGDGPPSVSISVQCCAKSDIRVIFRNSPKPLPLVRKKIVNRFLQKCCEDSDGDAVLASATLAWG